MKPKPTRRFASPPLAPTSIERRDPSAKDVAIGILFCGACRSDLHTAKGEWPGVPGHEIVGHLNHIRCRRYSV